MKTLKELIQQRAALLAALNATITKAQTEKRDLTAAEATEHDTKTAEIRSLDEQIKKRREFDALNSRQGEFETELRSPVSGPSAIPLDEAKNGNGSLFADLDDKRLSEIRSKFSFLKVVRHAAGLGKLDGIEAELMQEERSRANQLGIAYRGGFVPAVVLGMEMRAAATAAGDGTGLQLVGTQHQPGIIDGVIQPAYILQSLGINILTGLTSNVEFSRETNSTAAAFLAETADATEIALATEKFTLSPKRIATYTDFSQQLLLQTGPGIETYIRRMTLGKINALIQSAVINGSGSSNQPTGILNTTGIGAVAIGTNGGAPTWAAMVQLEREVDVDEALGSRNVYLTNGKARSKMKTTLRDSGIAGYIWGDDNTINGYAALSSNSVPSTLTKGTASGVCSAALFGDFSQVLLGQFGGIDMIMDQVTQAKAGTIRIHHATFIDVGMTRPQGIAAVKDLTTT